MVMVVNKKLNKNLEEQAATELLEEVKEIKSRRDLEKFLNKFFTRDEKKVLLRRLVVTELLKEGRKYRDIVGLLDVSKDTISAAQDILLGFGYDKRDKKRRYSESSIKLTSGSKMGFLSKFPKKTGKRRWAFLSNY
jgi:uncharacterized protein YerC